MVQGGTQLLFSKLCDMLDVILGPPKKKHIKIFKIQQKKHGFGHREWGSHLFLSCFVSNRICCLTHLLTSAAKCHEYVFPGDRKNDWSTTGEEKWSAEEISIFMLTYLMIYNHNISYKERFKFHNTT